MQPGIGPTRTTGTSRNRGGARQHRYLADVGRSPCLPPQESHTAPLQCSLRTTWAPTGPTEAINLLIKNVKRVGHGFRNFANYRLRLLLHCGVTWQVAQTASLRGRSPRRA